MGLVVFGVIGLYLLISVLVVRWAIRHARAYGKSVKRWGWGAANGEEFSEILLRKVA